ncbi:hypothetical protein [Paraburkholderia diazotrophica]|uniref:Uncharacterized protein n=1 Tax=Paraburkholderia diazotrophica TaxID=667676 RepID=A0A1H7ESR6_9BURK|nr:hypothetical protein [Paraburkholderia diazotrophica]SEK13785.1 hypothetical protein SAMN05192539_10765 [Paraburkholderia diazotrophica]
MRSSPRSHISITATLTLGLMLSAYAQAPNELPTLLRDVTAHGGYWGACPPTSGALAISPELDSRLKNNFPPGSDGQKLEGTLVKEGFHIDGVCNTDGSIHIAGFFRKGVGLLRYDVSAQVYWKVDQEGRVVWTKGFVMYIGL